MRRPLPLFLFVTSLGCNQPGIESLKSTAWELDLSECVADKDGSRSFEVTFVNTDYGVEQTSPVIGQVCGRGEDLRYHCDAEFEQSAELAGGERTTFVFASVPPELADFKPYFEDHIAVQFACLEPPQAPAEQATTTPTCDPYEVNGVDETCQTSPEVSDCVSEVCQVYLSCCDGSWNTPCVRLASNLCDV